MAGKYKIVMVRHGESEWNQKNLFCGWFDANLSEKGMCHYLDYTLNAVNYVINSINCKNISQIRLIK